MFVCGAGRFQFKAIVGSDMRPFFAILGLLLFLIAAQGGVREEQAGLNRGRNASVFRSSEKKRFAALPADLKAPMFERGLLKGRRWRIGSNRPQSQKVS